MEIIDIEFLKNLTLKAGKIALKYFGRVIPHEKSDKTLVTEADIKLDEFITLEINKKYPYHLILSEELGRKKGEVKENIVWAIDPLDGTAAFSSGLPIWGISIGILIDNIPTYGAFYIPVTDELYYSDGRSSYLWNQKIKVSKISLDENTFLAVPSDAHRSFDLKNFPGKTRSMGSIAAHICYVARGIAAGAIMRGHIWDIAAGDAILRSAEGETTYLDGMQLEWEELYSCKKAKKTCIAAGKENYKELIGFIKK
ncbi:MAG TPA: inositol monophosphatase [Candidatus Eremiobacteraeota bacterium]|nr:MAG: Inositol-1-monophosphatase [bacterium ADurb.Bin363]HPZ07713.1 inositol monophosphatase [Candidatus Eremiobacteraeota bacterium]